MINKTFRLSILVAIILPFSSQSAWALSTEERVKRLERMADNPVLLQLSQRVSEQQREIQRLQDEMDRIGRDIRSGTQQDAKRYTETDQRISNLELKFKSLDNINPPTVEPIIAIKPEPVKTTAVATNDSKDPVQKVIAVRPATAEENDRYQAAFALMRAAKYDESIKLFEAFLSKNPESSLASNASYWAGEGYLIRKEYDKALDAFHVILDSYPDSSKVPDALLRSADSLASLKKVSEARVYYQKVLDIYPDSGAAKSAQKRIQ